MNEELYLALYELKTSLKNDERVITLEKLNEQLENDEQVQILSYRLDVASREYNDILKIYDMNHEIAKEYQKRLHLAKMELDKLDIVKRYNKAYREVKELYDIVNKEIFYPFTNFKCKKG